MQSGGSKVLIVDTHAPAVLRIGPLQTLFAVA